MKLAHLVAVDKYSCSVGNIIFFYCTLCPRSLAEGNLSPMRIMRASFPLRHLKPEWGDHIMLIISRICLFVKAEAEIKRKVSLIQCKKAD